MATQNQTVKISRALLVEIAVEFRRDIKTLTSLVAMGREAADIDNTQELLRAADRFTNDLHQTYLRLNDLLEAEVQS